MAWQFIINSLHHFVIEAFKILSSEWRLESSELIYDASTRPDVRLRVVGLILPHLWTSVVRSARLGIK